MTKPSICLYFHLHQPTRLRRYSVFDKANRHKGTHDAYFDDGMDKHYFHKIANQCYRPANKIIQEAITESDGAFKVSFSITGVWLDQCMKYAPDVLESFRRMARTGSVEFVDETYYHSLSSLWWDAAEFNEQVRMHSAKIAELFGQQPRVFRNTELIYSNRIASQASSLGFEGILAEGVDRVLGWRSPNYVYTAKGSGIKVLLRNYRLSDDIGFRFSERSWSQWPLTADKYVSWLDASTGQTINLFMDYETFGEHHWPGSGVMEFLHHFPRQALRSGLEFKTVGQTVAAYPSSDVVDSQSVVSWADLERDASAWLGNKIQDYAFSQLWRLEKEAKAQGGAMLDTWRRLGVSDHFMYLCLKSWADGDVHKHFSPYKDWNPYDNFINYMNILNDFESRLRDGAQRASRSMGPSQRMPAIAADDSLAREILAAVRGVSAS